MSPAQTPVHHTEGTAMTATRPLSADQLATIDAYWRAANYLSVGQIYLYDNPLLREPLTTRHIKPRLLGHFGTTPGLNLVYAHLNRVIKERDLDVIYLAGRSRHEAVVHPVLVSRRHPEPPRAGDAELDARGR